MNIARLLMTLALVVVSAKSAVAQSASETLSDDQIRAAIASAAKFKPLRLGEGYNITATGFALELYSPTAWIQMLAKTALQQKKPFTLDDVTPELRGNLWHVKVWPSTPRTSEHRLVASSVTDIVARSETKSIEVRPVSKEPFEFRSIIDQTTYTGLVAVFPGEKLTELWGPNQDREFVFSVAGDHWKYDFTIKKKHFEQLK